MYHTIASSFPDKPSISRALEPQGGWFSLHRQLSSSCPLSGPRQLSLPSLSSEQWDNCSGHPAGIKPVCAVTLGALAENPPLTQLHIRSLGSWLCGSMVAAWWPYTWEVLLSLLWWNYRTVARNASVLRCLKSTPGICSMPDRGIFITYILTYKGFLFMVSCLALIVRG